MHFDGGGRRCAAQLSAAQRMLQLQLALDAVDIHEAAQLKELRDVRCSF